MSQGHFFFLQEAKSRTDKTDGSCWTVTQLVREAQAPLKLRLQPGFTSWEMAAIPKVSSLHGLQICFKISSMDATCKAEFQINPFYFSCNMGWHWADILWLSPVWCSVSQIADCAATLSCGSHIYSPYTDKNSCYVNNKSLWLEAWCGTWTAGQHDAVHGGFVRLLAAKY